jgi:hypothetical protein
MVFKLKYSAIMGVQHIETLGRRDRDGEWQEGTRPVKVQVGTMVELFQTEATKLVAFEEMYSSYKNLQAAGQFMGFGITIPKQYETKSVDAFIVARRELDNSIQIKKRTWQNCTMAHHMP